MKAQVTYNTVSQQLKEWYEVHKRTMPWRGEKDPYYIWLSEVILQQTRVEQGRPYYERFVTLFPVVHDLAAADEQDVLKAWEGLGYYSRARNLHKAAKIISLEMNGVFPRSYAELKELPGIGEYTAAAIASICFDEKIAVVDGNVNRFISRYYGVAEIMGTSAFKKSVRQHAQSLMDESASAGDFNQALMEFGALQCVPKSPDCNECPLIDDCPALRNDMVSTLPLKKKARASRDRFFLYSVPIKNGYTYIQRRAEDDIWAGLYEFALAEKDLASLDPVEFPERVLADERMKHVLSHQNIHARFVVYEGAPKYGEERIERVLIEDLKEYPFSRLSTRFMEKTSHIWNPKEE